MIVRRHLFTCLVAVGLPACVGVPVAVPESKPFVDMVGSELVVGETKSATVRDKLGQPDFDDDSRWVYRKSRAGWNWLVCGYAVVTAGCGTSGRNDKEYFLLAGFDEAGVVATLDVLDAESLCAQQRLCFHEELLMRESTAVSKDDGRTPAAPGQDCEIYIYSRTSNRKHSGNIEVNGRGIGAIVGDTGYFRHVSESGRVFVSITSRQLPHHHRVASANFVCGAQETIYLRYHAGFWNMELDRIDAAEATEQLQDRWAALAEVDPAPVAIRWLREHAVFVVGRGDDVRVFKNKGPGLATHWASGDIRDTCADEIALEEYGLVPYGGRDRFGFALDGQPGVDFVPVCNSSSECGFRLLLGGETCRAWRNDSISYGQRNWLIVVEPHGDAYREIYSGESKRLDDIADCARGRCNVAIAALRKFGVDSTVIE